jgi:4'-phosphopantetheinyl transferase EntD
MASLLSPDVVVVETSRPSPLETEPLMAEEAAQLGPATIERRRREFTVGRACARRALQAFGIVGVAVSTGLHREPKWPRGVVGSITHCAGYCAAAVALGDHVAGIGIDAEVNTALPQDLVAMVCTPAERRWLQSAPDTGIDWPTLIFSAKESIFKAWFPLARRWLGFEDAELTLDPVSGGFSARLLVPLPNSLHDRSTPFAGRFVATKRHLFTAVVIPRRSQESACTSCPRSVGWPVGQWVM